MDMQGAILASLPEPDALLTPVARAIARAREKEIPVIYVVVGFRPGAPEISSANKVFAAFSDAARWTPEFAEQWAQIHPGVAPQPGEVIVTKRRISAFTGSDLEVILRAQNIRHLVLTGISTSGVILSTLREAADKDYRLTVISDCCADREEEVHRVLLQQVFPRQADVIGLEDWI